MSAAVTPGAARAIEALDLRDAPALVFDRDVLAARLQRLAAIARAAGVQALFAAKACPLPAVLELARAHLAGLDVAGPDEQAALVDAPPTTVSVTWPGDVDVARLAALAAAGHRVIAVGETAAALAAAAAAAPSVELAVRLSVSELCDEDAPGGLRTERGHSSRFGVAPAELPALVAAAGPRLRALHLHGGPLATSPARLARLAAAAVAAARAAGLPLARLDLGGSLHGFALDPAAATAGQATLADALAAARAAVPAAVELAIEPGRLVVDGAGFAAGRVLAARTIAGREARVLSLSRLCHLRWSSPRLVAPPPRAGEAIALTLLGATCCEDDVIADARVPAHALPAVGDRVVLAAVSGYAAAWNRGFAGIPPARVVVT